MSHEDKVRPFGPLGDRTSRKPEMAALTPGEGFLMLVLGLRPIA